MTQRIRKMWRVVETSPPHRRGTATLVSDSETKRETTIVNFDEGTRTDIVGAPTVTMQVGEHEFAVMGQLPVTADKVHQHVASIPVVPRIGNPDSRRKK